MSASDHGIPHEPSFTERLAAAISAKTLSIAQTLYGSRDFRYLIMGLAALFFVVSAAEFARGLNDGVIPIMPRSVFPLVLSIIYYRSAMYWGDSDSQTSAQDQ